MKTTLEIPADTYRQIKITAAMEGRKIGDLVTEGLNWVVRTRASAGRTESTTAFDLMRGACGCVESGVRDLATNPKHMEGFGRA